MFQEPGVMNLKPLILNTVNCVLNYADIDWNIDIMLYIKHFVYLLYSEFNYTSLVH